jgi:hypothetical protein
MLAMTRGLRFRRSITPSWMALGAAALATGARRAWTRRARGWLISGPSRALGVTSYAPTATSVEGH